jgi:lysophospholipase L1-like esterase
VARGERRPRVLLIAVAAVVSLVWVAAGNVSASAAGGVGYFALGDSYASGEGTPDSGTTFNESQLCHRSDQAWPHRLGAADPGLSWVGSAACSGAPAAAITGGYRGLSAQADTLSRYAAQVRVVTVTIGGNDIGFTGVLVSCFAIDCHLFGTVRASVTKMTTTLPGQLATAYAAIRHAAPNSRIVVVGYPRIFPTSQDATHNCGWLTPTERTDVNNAAATLDSTIGAAANRAGFDYVSTLNAFSGHELCTSSSWVNLVGFALHPEYDGHPNAAGQAALATTVQTYLTAHQIA